MRQRVQAVGGFIDISSSPNSGTRIEVRVPVLEYCSEDVTDGLILGAKHVTANSTLLLRRWVGQSRGYSGPVGIRCFTGNKRLNAVERFVEDLIVHPALNVTQRISAQNSHVESLGQLIAEAFVLDHDLDGPRFHRRSAPSPKISTWGLPLAAFAALRMRLLKVSKHRADCDNIKDQINGCSEYSS